MPPCTPLHQRPPALSERKGSGMPVVLTVGQRKVGQPRLPACPCGGLSVCLSAGFLSACLPCRRACLEGATTLATKLVTRSVTEHGVVPGGCVMHVPLPSLCVNPPAGPRTACPTRTVKLVTKPVAKPVTKPATKPVTRPVTRPVSKPRVYVSPTLSVSEWIPAPLNGPVRRGTGAGLARDDAFDEASDEGPGPSL